MLLTLEWIQQAAAARILVALIEEDLFISQLIRSAVNPEGIATQKSITYARRVLKKIGLIEEYSGAEQVRPRLYLRLTEKGRKVAQLLRQIEEILLE